MIALGSSDNIILESKQVAKLGAFSKSGTSSPCSCIGENITSLLTEWLLFEHSNFISFPLLSLSIDLKLTSDNFLPEDILSVDDKLLFTEQRLVGKDDNEERVLVIKTPIAEICWGIWTLPEHNPLYILYTYIIFYKNRTIATYIQFSKFGKA